MVLHLSGDILAPVAGPKETQIVASSLSTGVTFGEWCPYGLAGELPGDQRPDDGRSVYFDTAPLAQRVEIFGAPVLSLGLSADRPSAMIAARLEDVAPDGSSTLVTYGLLNLTHRDGHEQPEAIVPGRLYRVTVVLNDIAQAFPAGHRIRVALATSHWPIAWPSPELTTLTLETGSATLSLPVRQPSPLDGDLPAFAPAEEAEAEPYVITKLAGRSRTMPRTPNDRRDHRHGAPRTECILPLKCNRSHFAADALSSIIGCRTEPSASTAETGLPAALRGARAFAPKLRRVCQSYAEHICDQGDASTPSSEYRGRILASRTW